MDKIKEYVESKGCTFISATIVEGKTRHWKINIISSCGHESEVFYTNFKLKNSSVICKECRKNIISERGKTLGKDTLNIEHDGIEMIRKYISDEFYMEKTREGALADFIIKTKQTRDDVWYGVQIKTTTKKNYLHQYAFQINKKYDNCIMILNVLSELRIWCLPLLFDYPKTTINIGNTSKSKYAQYEVSPNHLIKRLLDIIKNYQPYPFAHWNKSSNVRCDLEDYFINIRESKLSFLSFALPHRNSSVYDFTVNDYKVQEKSISLDNRKKKTMAFKLAKNNGSIRSDGKKFHKCKPYEKGDNDFYWLWCKESPFFYIIPEDILFENHVLGDEGHGNLIISKTKEKPWLKPYTFDINNIDEAAIKALFHIFD